MFIEEANTEGRRASEVSHGVLQCLSILTQVPDLLIFWPLLCLVLNQNSSAALPYLEHMSLPLLAYLYSHCSLFSGGSSAHIWLSAHFVFLFSPFLQSMDFVAAVSLLFSWYQSEETELM